MADVSDAPKSPAPTSYTKRRRSPTPPPADPYALPDDEPVYVPLKQRRAQLIEKLSAKGGGGGVTAAAEKRKHEEETEEREQREREEAEAKRKKREHQTLLMEAQEVKRQKAIEGACARSLALLSQPDLSADLHFDYDADAAKTERQKREEEEAKILAAQEATRKTLAGAEEIAKGIVYTERMKTS